MKKSFIDVIDPEYAEGSLKRAYRRVGGLSGKIANIYQAQSLHPKAMLGHLELYLALMYDNGSAFSRLERELIGTVVSTIHNCKYCIFHHYEALRQYWKDAPSPKELIEGNAMDDIRPGLVKHVSKLVIEPWNIDEADIQELKDLGYDDRGILEITMLVSYFCFVNRVTLGMGVKLEDPVDWEYNMDK